MTARVQSRNITAVVVVLAGGFFDLFFSFLSLFLFGHPLYVCVRFMSFDAAVARV